MIRMLCEKCWERCCTCGWQKQEGERFLAKYLEDIKHMPNYDELRTQNLERRITKLEECVAELVRTVVELSKPSVDSPPEAASYRSAEQAPPR